MKKIVVIVAVLTLVTFVAVATAQQKPAPAPAPAPAKPAGTAAPAPAPEKAKAEKPKAAQAMKFSGTVEKVDEMAKSIVVKGKKDSMTFVLGDKAKITKAGKDTPLAEVKKDMEVSVDYLKEGDKLITSAIRVSAPKAAPKEKPAAKPAEAPKAPEPPKK